jgi:hypothetical protein
MSIANKPTFTDFHAIVRRMRVDTSAITSEGKIFLLDKFRLKGRLYSNKSKDFLK